jgi:hypothetical protein
MNSCKHQNEVFFYFNVNTNCLKYWIGDTKTAKYSNFSKKKNLNKKIDIKNTY